MRKIKLAIYDLITWFLYLVLASFAVGGTTLMVKLYWTVVKAVWNLW